MSDEKLTLIAVSKTLIRLEKPVLDVRLTSRDSKFGPTGLYLDARMHSVAIQVLPQGLKISSAILERPEKPMTSENDVISQQSLILSVDDSRVIGLKYHPGDMFTVTKVDDSFHADPTSLSIDRQVIIEIQGYGLSYKGDIFYDAYIIEPEEPELDFHWLLSDEDLKESFYYLGASYQEARFALIDV